MDRIIHSVFRTPAGIYHICDRIITKGGNDRIGYDRLIYMSLLLIDFVCKHNYVIIYLLVINNKIIFFFADTNSERVIR